MRVKYVIAGVIVFIIGFIGFAISLYHAQEQIRSIFSDYFPVWIMVSLAGIPVIVSGFVKKFHIVFAIIASFALVLIWFQGVRYN